MTEVLDTVKTTIEGRLQELEAEATRLRGVLTNLDGRRTRQGRRGHRSSAARSRRPAQAAAKNGGRKLGKRQQQFLDAVEKAPGARVSEIAKSIGIRPQQGYAIARRLRQQGSIRKRGKGYAVRS